MSGKKNVVKKLCDIAQLVFINTKNFIHNCDDQSMVLSLRKTMPFDLHVSLRTVYNSLIIGQNPIQDSQSMVYLRKKLIQVYLNRFWIKIAFKLNLAERFD